MSQSERETVVTYQGRGLRISLCAGHAAQRQDGDNWPRGTDGVEAVDVYMGEHDGVCDDCEDEAVRGDPMAEQAERRGPRERGQ